MAKIAPSLLPVLFFACLPGAAQREVPAPAYMQPGQKDAVVAGDRLSRTITCSDPIRVYILGQGNEVQVQGPCGLVRIQGNRNFVWVDRDAQIAVEGNDNMVFIRTSSTRVSSRGNGNRFALRP